jgi:prepilin-type N-terminal cleavage/methylation domain-containing protein
MKAGCERVRRAFRAQDGFTLVELLAVVAILGVVLAALTQLFTSGTNSEVVQTDLVRAQQDTRVALDRMRREIHSASSVSSNQGDTDGDGDASSDTDSLPGGDGDGLANGTYPAKAVTIVLPSYCPGYVSGVASVTWCTSATSPYTLYRYPHSTDVSTSSYSGACTGTGTSWTSNIVGTSTVTNGRIFVNVTSPTQPAMQAPDFEAANTSSVTDCGGGTKLSSFPSGSGKYDCAYGYVVDPVVNGVEQPGLEGTIILYQAQIPSGSITVDWTNACPPYTSTATNNAISAYKIYGRAPGGELYLGSVSETAGTPCGTTKFTDSGSGPAAGAASPVSGSLSTLSVAIPIRVTSGGKKESAELTDNITLRNTPR